MICSVFIYQIMVTHSSLKTVLINDLFLLIGKARTQEILIRYWTVSHQRVTKGRETRSLEFSVLLQLFSRKGNGRCVSCI